MSTNNSNHTLDAPARNAIAVSPSDTNDLAIRSRALFIGGAGDIKVDMVDKGEAVIFKGLSAGQKLDIQVTRVYSTDTTATDIVNLF